MSFNNSEKNLNHYDLQSPNKSNNESLIDPNQQNNETIPKKDRNGSNKGNDNKSKNVNDAQKDYITYNKVDVEFIRNRYRNQEGKKKKPKTTITKKFKKNIIKR